MKLFHGSTVAVETPNLRLCRKTTDFGKGFYTTTNFEQAKKWSLLKQERSGSAQAIKCTLPPIIAYIQKNSLHLPPKYNNI
jgi:hypothetical protein